MESVITDVINIIEEGCRKAHQTINTSIVEAYWLAGKRIVEDELEGQDRAEYGKFIIKKLADALTLRFGISCLFRVFGLAYRSSRLSH